VIAQANLGEMLARGVGVGRDPVRAWAWLRLAADGGNAWARGQAKGIWNRLSSHARGRAMAALARIEAERAARP
jgi:TPR repeat protein